MQLRPIGIVRSPYKSADQAPRQGRYSQEEMYLQIYSEFMEGLRDVQGGTDIIVIYWLNRAERDKLTVTPPHVGQLRGVFSTRSPHRPNPIGFCVAKVSDQGEDWLRVKGLDAIDETPLLDIKPYSEAIDCPLWCE